MHVEAGSRELLLRVRRSPASDRRPAACRARRTGSTPVPRRTRRRSRFHQPLLHAVPLTKKLFVEMRNCPRPPRPRSPPSGAKPAAAQRSATGLRPSTRRSRATATNAVVVPGAVDEPRPRRIVGEARRGRAARCCTPGPCPAASVRRKTYGDGVASIRSSAATAARVAASSLPLDAARARRVAHVQRAVVGSTENTGPVCGRPRDAVRRRCARESSSRRARISARDVARDRRRAAAGTRSRGRAARSRRRSRPARTQCRTIARIRRSGGL